MKKILLVLTMLMPLSVMTACLDNTEIATKDVVLPALRGNTVAEATSALNALGVKYSVNGTGYFSHYGSSLKPGDTINTGTTIRLFFYENLEDEHENTETSYPSLDVTPNEVLVKYIDIGADGSSAAGEAAYVKIGHIDILIDGGEDASNARVIKNVLDANMTDNTIEYLISSHDHQDHMGGYPYFLHNYDITMAFEANYVRSNMTWIPTYRAVLEETNAHVCKFTEALGMDEKEGCYKVYNIAPEVSITFLNTGTERISDSNHSSIVFVLEVYGTKFLFNGDAETTQERTYAALAGKVDFLKAAHHGTKNGNSLHLMNTVKPDNYIITNGSMLHNKHAHPTNTAVNNVYQANNKTNIYATTGGCGTIGNSVVHACMGTTAKPIGVDRNEERNGDINVAINSSGYTMSAANRITLIELSQTVFWKNHSGRVYKHINAGY